MSYVRETHYKRTIEKLKAKLTPQPIETAPKDGTEILAWENGHWYSTAWFVWDDNEPGEWSTDDFIRRPTHWLPLPEAPK